MIDHVGLGVSDLEESKAFYLQALSPLGYQLVMERDGSAGFGHNGKPDFWIHANRPLSGPTHVAIASSDRATVDAFHAAGLAAGGPDNGPPGPRPQYHQDFGTTQPSASSFIGHRAAPLDADQGVKRAGPRPPTPVTPALFSGSAARTTHALGSDIG